MILNIGQSLSRNEESELNLLRSDIESEPLRSAQVAATQFQQFIPITSYVDIIKIPLAVRLFGGLQDVFSLSTPSDQEL